MNEMLVVEIKSLCEKLNDEELTKIVEYCCDYRTKRVIAERRKLAEKVLSAYNEYRQVAGEAVVEGAISHWKSCEMSNDYSVALTNARFDENGFLIFEAQTVFL